MAWYKHDCQQTCRGLPDSSLTRGSAVALRAVEQIILLFILLCIDLVLNSSRSLHASSISNKATLRHVHTLSLRDNAPEVIQYLATQKDWSTSPWKSRSEYELPLFFVSWPFEMIVQF
jgi:hypothetical protein